jgi:hypothetical protein
MPPDMLIPRLDAYVDHLEAEVRMYTTENTELWRWSSDVIPLLQHMARSGSVDAQGMIDRYDGILEDQLK